MKLSETTIGDVVVLEMSGKIMGGPDATILNDKLHELIEQGKHKTVANLARIDWMNSSGLGILIGGLTTMRNHNGDLKLAQVTERIRSLLKITRLHNIFEMYDTVEEAVASYEK
ncbi:MAG TPA: anti-sigma factor antagonist [Bacteroidetes bacterium]|nr:anti-sigma factor antagonist [Bacteroidota bacterium]